MLISCVSQRYLETMIPQIDLLENKFMFSLTNILLIAVFIGTILLVVILCCDDKKKAVKKSSRSQRYDEEIYDDVIEQEETENEYSTTKEEEVEPEEGEKTDETIANEIRTKLKNAKKIPERKAANQQIYVMDTAVLKDGIAAPAPKQNVDAVQFKAMANTRMYISLSPEKTPKKAKMAPTTPVTPKKHKSVSKTTVPAESYHNMANVKAVMHASRGHEPKKNGNFKGRALEQSIFMEPVKTKKAHSGYVHINANERDHQSKVKREAKGMPPIHEHEHKARKESKPKIVEEEIQLEEDYNYDGTEKTPIPPISAQKRRLKRPFKTIPKKLTYPKKHGRKQRR